MKKFKDLIEEVLNEGSYEYPGDDMTQKELKIAINSAKNILDMIEDGAMVQRWQISAIVKASEELASVYTSMSADEDEWEDDYEDEDPMYVGFEYPRMYGESVGGLFKNASEWESAAKSRGIVVKSITHPSGEATKYQIAKDKQGNNRGHFDHGTKSGHLKEEVEQIDEISKSTLGSYIRAASRDIDSTSNEAGKTQNRLQRNKLQKQTNKRLHGIEKATQRLTKEESEQIDEISYRDSGYRNMLKASQKADREADKIRAQAAKEGAKKKPVEEEQIDELSEKWEILQRNRTHVVMKNKKSGDIIKRYKDGSFDNVINPKEVEKRINVKKKPVEEENDLGEAKLERHTNTVGAHHLERDSGDHKMYTRYYGSLSRREHTVTDKDDNILGQGLSAMAAMTKAKLKKAHRDALMHDDNQIVKVHDTRTVQNVGTQVATPKGGKWFKDHEEAMKHAKSLPGKIRHADPKTGHVVSEELDFKVSVDGLPDIYVKGNSPSEVKTNLRKVIKKPDSIQSVDRVTQAMLKKIFRDKAMGKEEIEEETEVDESSFVAKAAHAKVAGQKTFKLKGSDKEHPVTIKHHHAKKIKQAVSEESELSEEWYKDKEGKTYPFSKPFDSRNNAVEFAKKHGLGKSAVKSRPAGYVVEKPSVKESDDIEEAYTIKKVYLGKGKIDWAVIPKGSVKPETVVSSEEEAKNYIKGKDK
jgi:hypothetical protein